LLLSGFVTFSMTREGVRALRSCYPSNEAEARRAFAKLLRSEAPLDRQLRNALADVFDPDMVDGRTVQFQFRSKKRRPDHLRNACIRQYITDRIAYDSVGKAIEGAAVMAGISAEAVRKIWQQHLKAAAPPPLGIVSAEIAQKIWEAGAPS